MRHRIVVLKSSSGPAAINAGDVGQPSPQPTIPLPRRRRSEACQTIYARAMVLWPRLDRGRLRRTQGDPLKVARLIARRTVLTEESILSLLLG
jgi:hypothetical protein